MTVPQLNPLCRLFALLLGTQGSSKVWGNDVGVCWAVCSRQAPPQEERGGLLRAGRRLRESERNGGGGGRLDLRREMLRVQELEEEALFFLLFSKGDEVIFSEHKEVLSV